METHGQYLSKYCVLLSQYCPDRNACVDSYRALVLKPDWGKPYYRCTEAWMLLGNLTMAKQMNVLGCEMCPMNSDLSRQKNEIMIAVEKQER